MQWNYIILENFHIGHELILGIAMSVQVWECRVEGAWCFEVLKSKIQVVHDPKDYTNFENGWRFEVLTGRVRVLHVKFLKTTPPEAVGVKSIIQFLMMMIMMMMMMMMMMTDPWWFDIVPWFWTHMDDVLRYFICSTSNWVMGMRSHPLSKQAPWGPIAGLSQYVGSEPLLPFWCITMLTLIVHLHNEVRHLVSQDKHDDILLCAS